MSPRLTLPASGPQDNPNPAMGPQDEQLIATMRMEEMQAEAEMAKRRAQNELFRRVAEAHLKARGEKRRKELGLPPVAVEKKFAGEGLREQCIRKHLKMKEAKRAEDVRQEELKKIFEEEEAMRAHWEKKREEAVEMRLNPTGKIFRRSSNSIPKVDEDENEGSV